MKIYPLFKSALIRAAYTAAEVAIGMIGTKQFISEIEWKAVGSAVLLATLVSLLKSVIIGTPESEEYDGNER